MKAYKIYETISFNQGGYPYEKMKIGSYAPIDIRKGDMFLSNEDIWLPSNPMSAPQFRKGEKIMIEDYIGNAKNPLGYVYKSITNPNIYVMTISKKFIETNIMNRKITKIS